MTPRRKIGSQGLVGPAVGLGCMALSVYYGKDTAGAEPATVIGSALDLGVNLVDTADAYGDGENERAVGRAIRGRRDEIVLSTKFGRGHHVRESQDRTVGRPEYVPVACDESLRRLGVDHLDIYVYHRVDPLVPVEETVGALSDLVRAGKVRFIGMSEIGPETLRRAHAVHPITLVQMEYSLLTRDAEGMLWQTLEELGVTLAAYSPLHRGLLSGRISGSQDLGADDWRATSPRFQGENLAANLRLVDRLRPIAAELGITLPQLALSWVIARGALPINGATTVDQLRENAAAARVRLPADVLAEIDRAVPPSAVAGARADQTYLKHVLST